MKKIYLILFLIISLQSFSQYVSTGIGRWKLGLNVGTTWQTADVSTDLFDIGYGATLEYALYEKRRSFFGFSLRGRFLQGKTTGYDYLINNENISNNSINGVVDTSINYSFSPLYLNNKTSLNEFSLEAMLKWNKLYQNHGILFYLYLGGGFTNYKVETDQLNTNNTLYDYSNINNNNGASTVNEIKNIQDGIYETELSNPEYNTLVFTPAIGAGLGFRITPGVDFAIEHKISLPQTDLFDGQINDNGSPSFIQDVYHYTSLGLIFSIVKHSEPETYIPPTEPAEPVITTPITNTTAITPIKPIISIIKPSLTSFNTPNCKVEIVAKIENVKEQKDITFYHNGNKVPSYKYFFSPTTFKSTIDLKEGNNNFKIVAKNGSLTNNKEFSLKCNNINTIDICHKNNDGSFTTLNIKESEWNTHQAHGDSKGVCPEKQVTICHNISGQPGKTQTITIDESKWLLHKSHGDYFGSCQEKKMITICHNNQTITINEKDWGTHAAHGDSKGECPQPQVNMITICHVPATGNKRQTISIPENEWIVHQAHGDYKGTCPPVEPTTTICHKNSNGTKTTMTIPEFRWNEHFSHGDSKSACPESSFIICHKDPVTGKKQNISIYESAWATHAAHGDTRGTCPENQITICHNIPGQPGKTQTISIPESKWLLHKSHGDTKGNCPLPQKKITICHNDGNSKYNLTINASEWAQHAAHGDIKGSCPVNVKQMTICHNISGKPGQTVTMTINATDWAQHAAHGDVIGDCSNVTTGTGTSTNLSTRFTICHNKPDGTKEPIQVNETEWKTHQLHGDVKGDCPQSGKQITICHNISGKPGQTSVMTIDQSEWAQHAAHGDVMGPCPSSGNGSTNTSGKFEICHIPHGGGTSQTILVTEKEWVAHQLHGDTKGPCSSGKKTKEAKGGKTSVGKGKIKKP